MGYLQHIKSRVCFACQTWVMALNDSHESSHGERCLPCIFIKKAKVLFLWTALNTQSSCCFSNTLSGLWKYVPDSKTQAAAFLESVRLLCNMSEWLFISTFTMGAKQQLNFSWKLCIRGTQSTVLSGFSCNLFFFFFSTDLTLLWRVKTFTWINLWAPSSPSTYSLGVSAKEN